MANNQVIVNNSLITFNAEGAGDRAIIFLHGWRSQKEIWREVTYQLTNLPTYQLCSIDLPGFGQSPAPKTPWTVGDYAGVVKGFVEKLELKNVIIVGHSFGGRVGIKLAAEYPSAVAKLVLVDAAGFTVRGKKEILYNLVATAIRPIFKPVFMQGLRKKLYRLIGASDYVATPELRETFLNVINEDLTAEMKRLTTPTLIIWGENDKETPVEFGQKMKLEIKNSRLEILQNAGHFSFLDKPEEFNKALIEFL